MRVKNNVPFTVRNLALAVALATASMQAGALLVADGKLGQQALGGATTGQQAATDEGYQFGWQIGFQDDKGNLIGNGQLWFGTAANGNQFLYFQMPLGYVDNTYGTNSDPSWVASTGKAHTFDNLLGSDSMGANPNFQWTNANAAGATSAARIDYIAECDGDPGVCNTAGYKSGGVGDKGTGITNGGNGASDKWDKLDSALTGSAASLLQVATSLEYNLQNFGAGFDVNSSTSPNWVKEVGYELEFAAGTFDPAKFGTPGSVQLVNNQVSIPGLLVLGDPHVSPPKKDFGNFTTPCLIGTCGAPEPGTTGLLVAGLAGMAWYARRRKQLVPVRNGPVPS